MTLVAVKMQFFFAMAMTPNLYSINTNLHDLKLHISSDLILPERRVSIQNQAGFLEK